MTGRDCYRIGWSPLYLLGALGSPHHPHGYLKKQCLRSAVTKDTMTDRLAFSANFHVSINHLCQLVNHHSKITNNVVQIID